MTIDHEFFQIMSFIIAGITKISVHGIKVPIKRSRGLRFKRTLKTQVIEFNNEQRDT